MIVSSGAVILKLFIALLDPLKWMTNLYTKILKIWLTMTDNNESTFQKMTDWFGRRSKRTQWVLCYLWFGILFVILPVLCFICKIDSPEHFHYFRELKDAYTKDFWEFRIEMKERLKEYQKVNTKLHRALK